MLNRLLLLASVCCLNSFAFPQENAKGLLVNAYKIDAPIKIDGVLDELLWQKALITDKFYDKKDSVLPYSNTSAYFAYDAKNLYVAFNCKVKDGFLLPKNKLEKDDENILSNDWVAVAVDTYNDGIAAYAFFSDSAGNQLDGSLSPKNMLTYSFSSNWISGVKQTTDGYTVEMKIPLAKLPIRRNNDSVEMAIWFVRSDKQNDVEIRYPFIKPDVPTGISHYRKVVLKGLSPTNPINLSGVDISERLNFKKSRINLDTMDGRSQGGDASVMDYAIFRKRVINGAGNPRIFPYSLQTKAVNKAFENTDYLKGYKINYGFETFLERSQTSAFMVISNGSIIYEKYFNGFNRKSVFTSFSAAKSFVSTLIGLAIKDGYIKSDKEKIVTYLPELIKKDPRFSDITIGDLLSMSSGLTYSGDDYPSDDDITYQSPDLRTATLQNVRIEKKPGQEWLYNNYNPLLLGLILERTTNKTVSEYMQEKLWKKMGGGEASWSLDEHGFEKMESGINCSIYDYARFGELFLNNGKYDDAQVVSKEWVEKATQPLNRPQGFYDDLLQHNIYYSYFWWGKLRGNADTANDFFAVGNKGEYVYVSPQKKIIVIRLGFEYGLPTPAAFSWPDMFYQFATDFRNVTEK